MGTRPVVLIVVVVAERREQGGMTVQLPLTQVCVL
jgi:hypothetical protein